MHLLTRASRLRSRARCLYTLRGRGDTPDYRRGVTRFEGKERKEETNETRNEQPEVSLAALRPLDPLADGSSLDRTEVPWLYCRLSLGLIVTSFA